MIKQLEKRLSNLWLQNLVANFLEYELSQSQLKSQLYTIVQSRIELELPSEESLEVESDE